MVRYGLPIAIVVLIASELIARGASNQLAQLAAFGAVATVFALSANKFGLREIYLLSVCAALTAAAFSTLDAPLEAIGLGMVQAAFLMSFIFLLTLLYETASLSPSIEACGAYLTGQPPGRRFSTLFWGTNTMALMFNLGIVSLLTPLAQKGSSQEVTAGRAGPNLERRQLNAILRGFAWAVVWSPTALAPLAVMELIDGIDRQRWTLLGLVVTAIIFLIAYIEDQLSYRPGKNRKPINRVTPPFPVKAFGLFVAAICWLFGLTFLLAWISGDSFVFGLLLSIPLIVAGWLIAMNRPTPTGLKKVVRQVRTILTERTPEIAPIAITLGASGFIGRLTAALIPTQTLIDILDAVDLPEYGLLYVLPLLITTMSFFALSPIMVAVFFGSLFGGLPNLPADPTHIAFAISCGWAIAMTASPFATTVLLMTRLTGQKGLTLTARWNWRFTIAATAALLPIFYVVTGGR